MICGYICYKVVYNMKEPIEKIEENHWVCSESLPWVLEGIERQIAEIERGCK